MWSIHQSPTFLTVHPTGRFHLKHQEEPQKASCHSWPVSAGEGTAVPTPLEGHRPAAPWGTRRPHGRNHTLPRRRGRVSVLPVLSGEGSVLKALGLQQRSVTAEHTATFRGLPWKFSQVPLTLYPCTRCLVSAHVASLLFLHCLGMISIWGFGNGGHTFWPGELRPVARACPWQLPWRGFVIEPRPFRAQPSVSRSDRWGECGSFSPPMVSTMKAGLCLFLLVPVPKNSRL